MRRLAFAVAVLLGLTALAAAAESYRDDLPLPAYRLLGGLLAQIRGRPQGGAPAGATKSLDLLAPLVRALDKKHATGIEKSLRLALDEGDRDAAYAAATALVLLDTQDLVEGVAFDDYTGWTDAKVRTRKAWLNYGLVAEDLHRRGDDLDRQAVLTFGRLIAALHAADMSTAPDAIAGLRDGAASALARLRAAVLRRPSPAPPGAGPSGGGGQ